jgi:outer membrane protein assembly factor BamB
MAMWMNDGTGYFPDQNPPTTWSAVSGSNILWKARMPNWCNGSPVVVAGRVYCMAEPLDYAPILLCLDAETGAELWRREIDPVDSLPDGVDKAQVRKDFARLCAGVRERLMRKSRMREFNARVRTGEMTLEDCQKESARLNAAAAPTRDEGSLAGKLRPYGLAFDLWHNADGPWLGAAFPTPVADDARVWVATAHNTAACYNKEGNRVWQRSFPAYDRDRKPEFSPRQTEYLGGRAWPGAKEGPFPGNGGAATSPVMVDGWLVLNLHNFIRVVGAEDGNLKWEYPDPVPIGQNMAVPQIVTVAGERLVITCSGGDVFRLGDGKHLGGPFAKGGKVSTPVHASGDVIVCALPDSLQWGAGEDDFVHKAYRLTFAGDRIVATELWSMDTKVQRRTGVNCGDLWRYAIHGGKIFTAQGVIDVATGRILRSNLPAPRRNYCWNQTIVAGNTVLTSVGVGLKNSKDQVASYRQYGEAWLNETDAVFLFRDATSGKVVGEATLPCQPSGGVDEAVVRASCGRAKWPWLGAAAPFVYRDRIYVRAYDFLYCIGKRKQATDIP